MDKNGDLIFDVDEARDIHNNAVEMLRRAVGVDVLTTFTDVDSVDLSDKNTTASQDDLEKVEVGTGEEDKSRSYWFSFCFYFNNIGCVAYL